MKLFEVIGLKKLADTTAHEMMENMLDAASEVMDNLYPDGPDEEENLDINFECKVFHDDGCASVVARDFDLCHCSCLRMEVHLMTNDEAALKLAMGKILPRDMVMKIRDDEGVEPSGDLN